MSRRANYLIIESESDRGRLVIHDIGPWDQFRTITNAAELVILELAASGLLWNGRKLFYLDSSGDRDELLHFDGQFVGFRPGR